MLKLELGSKNLQTLDSVPPAPEAPETQEDRRQHPRYERDFTVTLNNFQLDGYDISQGGISFVTDSSVKEFQIGRLFSNVQVSSLKTEPYKIEALVISSYRRRHDRHYYGARLVNLSEPAQTLHDALIQGGAGLNALLEDTCGAEKSGISPHLESRLVTALELLKRVYVYHLPPELLAVKEELYRPNPNLSQIESLIRKSPETLAEFIKIAKDAYPKKSIDQLMKVRTILNLIGLDNVFELFSSAILVRQHNNSPLENAIMKHGMNAGLAAAELSDSIDGISRSEAYLAGLLQNIGAVFLSKIDPIAYKPIFLKALSKPYTARQQELDMFDTSHSEAGVIIAKNWDMIPEIYKGILLHHSRHITPQIRQTHNKICNMALLMMLSDFVACSAMGQNYVSDELKQSRDYALSHLDISQEHVRAAYTMVITTGYKVTDIAGL